MKAILFAAAILAGATGAALAGEGNHEPFAQNLSGVPETYVVGSVSAAARSAASVPAYARLLPSNSNMISRETPNSLPAHFFAHRVARGLNG